MNKQRFSQLVGHYGGIKDDDRSKLHDLAKTYPYSQIIHTLLAKANTDANTDIAKQTLNYAALYTTDRSVLKDVIESQGTALVEEESVPSKTVKKTEAKLKELDKAAKEASVDTGETSEEIEVAEAEEDQKAQIQSQKHQKISIDPTLYKQSESENIRHEIQEDLEQLKASKANYLSIIDESPSPSTGTKKKTTSKSSVKKGPAKESKAVSTTAKPKTSTAAKSKKNTAPKANTSTTSRAKKTTSAKANAAKPTATKKTSKTASAKTSTSKTTTGKKASTTKKATPVKKKPKLEEQQEIINSFIKKEPSISSQVSDNKSEKTQADLAEQSTKFGEDLISENLAQILTDQGKKDKAIDIYKKLIWKFPQKKSYFAALIEDLKK